MVVQSVWREWCRTIGISGARLRKRRPIPRQWAAEILETRRLLSVIVVTSLADNFVHDGKVTLREAIQAANTNRHVDGSAAGQSRTQDQIVFQPGLTGTIKLNPALGALTITGTVEIVGLGAKQTVIDAQHNSRVFDVTPGAGNVTFNDLTITGGKTTAGAEPGGGIQFLSAGSLLIENSSVSGNMTTGFSTSGGGIYAGDGAVTVLNSTVSGNSLVADHSKGAGIFAKNGNIVVTNSTLSGNTTAGAYGSGVAVYAANGDVTLTNSTVTNNSAGGGNTEGGGVMTVRGSLTVLNSIVSGNTIASSPFTAADLKFVNYHGSATFTARNSLIGVNSGTPLAPAPVGSPDANGNLVGTFASPLDARLGPLADNGGPTQTHALLLGSPAINAGLNSLAVAPDHTPLTTDQRGVGFHRIAGGTVDMGSFEFHFPSFPLVVTTANDVLDSVFDPKNLSLRDAIALANTHPGLDTITFARSLSGVPIDLTLGRLIISSTVAIIGNGAKNTIIDAQHNSRVFDISTGSENVTLSGMTITGGETSGDSSYGGGILTESTGILTITNSAIIGNTTTGFLGRGAGIFTNSGAVTLVSSTISGNATTGQGGDGAGIFSQHGAVTLTNCTLSGNSTAGYHADGAAIYTVYAEAAITLTDTTVTANANNGADANGPAVTAVRASITLTNSIVSGNSITKGTAPDVGFGNYSHSGTFIARHSLIGVNSGTPLAPAPVGSPDANGNLVGTFASPLDARLGPLADNGGQTQTHALLLGSPAINAGNNSLAVAANGGPLKNDQRGAGFPRIIGGTVDMGSFEFQA